MASRLAHLTGLDGLTPRPHLALLPYAVSKGEYLAPSSSFDPFNDGSRYLGSAGLDLKLGVNGSLVLDATVNPDFGQVEVDPAVVNLTDFETFFEEKRPFFIEGSQLFANFSRNGSNNFWGFNRSDPQLFYSRRIGRSPQGSADADYVSRPSATSILGAAKLTGKTQSGWSLAVLDAVTCREWAAPSDGVGASLRRAIAPLANAFVARAFRKAAAWATAPGHRPEPQPPRPELATTSRSRLCRWYDGYAFLDVRRVGGLGRRRRPPLRQQYQWSACSASTLPASRRRRVRLTRPRPFRAEQQSQPEPAERPSIESPSGPPHRALTQRSRLQLERSLGGHVVGNTQDRPGRLFRDAFVAVASGTPSTSGATTG